MALTSASTRAAVLAQYKDNADYESDATGAKAVLFIQSIRFLLLDPERGRSPADGEYEYSFDVLNRQQTDARAFLDRVRATDPLTLPYLPRTFSLERFER